MSIERLQSISDVTAAQWDGLLQDDQPFLKHAFLACLEDSASVHPRTGWAPQHCLWRNAQGVLQAAMPCYVKSHSLGEYVFDMAWADASERAGIAYYPKLLGAIPFTPVQGARLLGAPEAAGALLDELLEQLPRQGCSGLHLNFTDTSVNQLLAPRAGWLLRLGCQYLWHNAGYRDFQDFLDGLSSRKRKQMRKEREQVLAQGLSFEWLAGHQLTEADWDFVYRCYANTYQVRGRHPYLSRAFFSLLAERMPQAIRVVLARTNGQLCAMAFSLQGNGRLYGRYWGCIGDYDRLHFETCLYQGIEQAISHGWSHFDGGAQGEHKLLRGFAPVLTHSWHWLEHAGLRRAVDEFLQQERPAVEAYARQAHGHLPYRKMV